MSDIPTPETDAAEAEAQVYSITHQQIEHVAKTSRNLERRLAVAVGQLTDIANLSFRKWEKEKANLALRRIDAMKEGRDE